jgi:hypothetical protein
MVAMAVAAATGGAGVNGAVTLSNQGSNVAGGDGNGSTGGSAGTG